jgi:hypothetical protein
VITLRDFNFKFVMQFKQVKQPSISTTAVLIFASSGARDSRAKGMGKAGFLFDELTHHTIDKVQHTGLPYFVHSDIDQQGDHFGERLTNSIQGVFDSGYDNVIAIGNDTPHLDLVHFRDALVSLEHRKTVIGPSRDGGFYLLGISGSAFAKARSQKNSTTPFSELSWNQDSLTMQLVGNLSKNGEDIEMLEQLMDIDCMEDARRIMGSENLDHNILQLLLIVLNTLTEPDAFERQLYYFNSSRIYFNKGSPSFIS